MKVKTAKFLKEHLALIIVITLLLLSPHILRAIDPTAGVYDAGVYQNMFLIATMYALFQWFTWSIVKAIWPTIATYANHFFDNDFKTLMPWQKIKTFLFIYFSILAAFLVLAVAVK